jgi:DNA-binding beta-propeller fold protein YncE
MIDSDMPIGFHPGRHRRRSTPSDRDNEQGAALATGRQRAMTQDRVPEDYPVEVSIRRRLFPLCLVIAVTVPAASCGIVSIHPTAGSSAITMQVPSTPQTIVISHDNREAFVSYGTKAITIVGLGSGRVLRTLHMDGQVSDMALSPNGKSLYVTLGYAESTTFDMQVINTNTDSASTLLPLGGSGQTVAISPNGHYAYVTFGSRTNQEVLGTINLASRSIVNTMPIPGDPQDAVITPNGRFLYIVSNPYITGSPSGQTNFDGQLIVVDTVQHRVTATLDEGQDLACGVAVAPDGNEFLESFCETEGTKPGPLSIYVYRTTTNTLLATIPIQDGAGGLAFSRDGRILYVATALNAIDLISTQTKRVTGSIPIPVASALGSSLNALALSPNGKVLCAGTRILPPYELLVVPLSKSARG